MCGICGFVGNGDLDDIQRMTQSMVHRGPDDGDIWHDDGLKVFLGHRRLSIIDLEGGAQPMWTTDGALGVTYNGEIYNHLALRDELEKKGHRFRTDHSDTEVLLHGYREWGEDLPNKLNGMWAFAVLDKTRREIFLSRDRFGKKPLFYTLQNGTFSFASELSALVQHKNIKTDVSTRSLKKYFAYGYIPAPNSYYASIYKLPGGHNLKFVLDTFQLSISKYWEFILEPFDNIPAKQEEMWGERLRELLERAVARRLMSDVPLGVFLSGGIDSSSITAFAVKHMGGEKLHTFSIGFKEQSFDESAYARFVADLFEVDHHSWILSMNQARDLAPEIISRLDEPMGDSSLLPTYLLCRETRKHVTVALGGDGGDEFFAGYDPFRALKYAKLYSKLVPRSVHMGIRLLAGLLPTSHRNMSPDFRIKRTLRGLSYEPKFWNPSWLGPLDARALEELFQEPMDLEDLYSEAIEAWDVCTQDNLVDQTLQFYTNLYLQDDILVKTDRASMMNSLEVRAPFLDIELVDFVRRIPANYKFRNGQTKYLLKEALKSILPKQVLYRSKKGFGVPVGLWFMKGRLGFNEQAKPPHVNGLYFHRCLMKHKKGTKDYRDFLWNYWVLLYKHSKGANIIS